MWAAAPDRFLRRWNPATVSASISASGWSKSRGKTIPNYSLNSGDAEDPDLAERLGGPFDVIILSDTVGFFDDCETALRNLQPLCTPDTRIIIAYYSKYWEPILSMAEMFGMKMRQPPLNWLSSSDIANLLHLADFDIIKRDWRQLLPRRLFGLGPLVNRFIGDAAVLPAVFTAQLRCSLPHTNGIAGRPVCDGHYSLPQRAR